MSVNDTRSHAPRPGHVGINVSDLDRSVEFYGQTLGYRKLGEGRHQESRYAFLGDGNDLILTLWQQSTGRFEKRRPGLHHLSFQVGTVEDLQRAEGRLRTLGVRFQYEGIVAQAEGLPSAGLFFEDPDGTRLEIFTPQGGSARALPVPGAPSCGFF